ncbi:S46 family peptidase [Niabella yanshanensis]|uniref:Dipeptidyl-peptidase n=1 Tax=Niabella yanshanensis TaxID=577386 RepID=A0ABZ0W0G3_9BACT|nr:S46 family peptidase [Niabella yanshanensis]WQD36667.1 S46 family peptidase [Niabella yanshanensis]
MKKLSIIFLVLLFSIAVRADEGMWLPQLLEALNEKRMKSLGMKMDASDIYNVNKESLKDAIVSFGGFCTGEVISDQGLVLTNHHCGFDAIQNHSTLDHNFIRDGFWAKSNAEELPNAGLFVTFIVRIEDVTDAVLKNVNNSLAENMRQSLVDRNAKQRLNEVTKETYQGAFIRPFFEGNKYYLFITETYNDVRLVGAPPSSIGNFGKDTDNWMWPRHTGDFSMFRIYAGKDNKPASYSPDNVPYRPKKSLSIAMNGMKEGDFTMIFGFPGRTTEYLPSEAVNQIMTVNDPAKIAIRDKALAAIDKYMRSDEAIKIQYASKYAGISNAWKKWQGEVLGLTNTNAVGKKQKYEAEYSRLLNNNPALKANYGTVLGQLNEAYKKIKNFALTRDYYLETTSKIELFQVVQRIRALGSKKNKPEYAEALIAEIKWMDNYLKEMNLTVDKDIFAAMMQLYLEQPSGYIASRAKEEYAKFKDYKTWANDLYSKTIFADQQKLKDLLSKDPGKLFEALTTDQGAQLVLSISNLYDNEVAPELNKIQTSINQLQRLYMKAQMDVFTDKIFYPDANSTLRVAFGNVSGYSSPTGKKYEYYTYMDGLMEKYKPGDYEFDVPEKLRELYKKKDYGKYGSNGKMPVCFIASNHTTGGNSGSPALDAHGNLVGLNFDRVWEGTMSDVNYDPSICRNIMVDIRYILFIVDKFAGAGHLVNEMKLVYPKKTY